MITVVIPVFNLTPHRKRNLEFIYDRLVDAGLKIILGIQDAAPDLDLNYYSRFEKANLVLCPSPEPHLFSKGTIFNECVKHIRTSFFMFLDADIYFPFKNITLQEDDEVVKPFSQCVYLDEEKTAEFLQKRSASVGKKYHRISCLGGGAVIIKTDLALREPLFDDRFLGWGWEDMDFGDMLRAKFKIRMINQPATHLYHEPSVPNHENSRYYHEKPKPKSKLVHFFHFQSSNDVFLSYAANKKVGFLLMNFSELDGLEDDGVKMWFMKNEDLCLDFMASSASSYTDDEGFMMYLEPETIMEPGFYQRVLDEARGKHALITYRNRVVGFALSKSKFSGFGRSISPEGGYLEDISLFLKAQGSVSEIKLQSHPCRCPEGLPNTSCPASASKCQES